MVELVYDFSDWTDLVEDGGGWTDNSNPATIPHSAGDSVIYSVQQSYTEYSNVELYARFRLSTSVQVSDRAAIIFKLGSQYVIFGYYHLSGDKVYYRRTASTRWDTNTDVQVSTSTTVGVTINIWYWLAVTKDNIGNVKFYVADGDLPTRPLISAMTELTTLATNITNANITEFGIGGNKGSAISAFLYMDDLGILDGDDVVPEKTLALGTAKIIGRNAVISGGAQGFGRILISDPLLANYATILTNMKKLYNVIDDVYGTSFLLGEISYLEIVDDDTIALGIQSTAIKTRKQKCNYTPAIQPAAYLKYVEDDQFWDHIDGIAIGLTGDMVTIEKESLTTMKIYPINLTEDHAPVGGDRYSLYQDAVWLDYGTDPTYKLDYTIFEFFIYATDVSVITNITIEVLYRILAENGGYSINPDWEIYDYNAVDWISSFTAIGAIRADDSDDTLLGFYHNYTVLQAGLVVANLLSEVAGANASGFKKYAFRIRFYSGDRDATGGEPDHHYSFNMVNITVDMDVDQPPSIGQGLIDAASDANHIAFDNVTPSWALSGFPASEGYGEGDLYYVTKSLSDIMLNIFSNADTDFIYSHQITEVLNHVLFTDDISMKYIYTILEAVKDTLNAPWWLEPASNAILQRSIDNLVATGLTLTQADFVGGFDGITYAVDATNIRTTATIIGKNEINSAAITEEYTLEGGNEEEIITKQDIVSPYALGVEIANLVKKHTNANISLLGILNYSNPLQDYSPIGLYKTLVLTLDDGNGNQIISHATLTIVKIDYTNDESTGYQEFVKIWLEELIA